MIAFDFDVMKAEFAKRYAKYRGKQIDNSSLPAGSPMYYYCKGCEALLETRPEGWFGRGPEPYCTSCTILAAHGMLDELKKEARCDDSE